MFQNLIQPLSANRILSKRHHLGAPFWLGLSVLPTLLPNSQFEPTSFLLIILTSTLQVTANIGNELDTKTKGPDGEQAGLYELASTKRASNLPTTRGADVEGSSIARNRSREKVPSDSGLEETSSILGH